MIDKNAILKEFNQRIFDESYPRIIKCLSLIDEKELWDSPSKTIPSIGSLILHVCGNAKQWILSGMFSLPDNRDRDDEFIAHPTIRKDDLIAQLENLKAELQDSLSNLEDTILTKEITIQGFKVTGYSSMIHVLEHFSYHTGQITLLAKLYSNQETNYYGDCDLNTNNQQD